MESLSFLLPSAHMYSHILSLAVFVLALCILLSFLAYCGFSCGRRKFQSFSSQRYMQLMGILAIFATIFSLGYQFVYGYAVCELCWWQRICMFPLDLIILVSLYTHARSNHVIVGLLAFCGLLFAAYHSYIHIVIERGQKLLLSCDISGPSCGAIDILAFGFFTIPMMAFIVFLALLWLSFLASQTKK